MSVRTAAIVVNWNNHADTAECVESLRRSGTQCRIIVVDNGSRPDDVEPLERIGGVTLIKSRENLGFGRGNNLGIKKALEDASNEFIFLLNNDATVMPDTVGLLEGALDARPEAGITAPRILFYENPEALWYGGGDINWAKGMCVVLPGLRGPADAPSAMTGRDISFASGCAMLIRRSVFESIGGFDPRLFMYVEDVDLCLRTLKSGWAIRYLPSAVVLHKGQGSQRKGDKASLSMLHPKNPKLPFYTYHIVKNMFIVMSANAGWMDALKFYFVASLFWFGKCAYFALHGRGDAVVAFFSGIRDGLHTARARMPDELKEDEESCRPSLR